MGWSLLTFWLHGQGHIVGRVVLLPEGTQPLIDIDLQLLWLLLQRLGISWCVTSEQSIQQQLQRSAENGLKNAGISVGIDRLGSCLSTPVCSRWTYPKEGCVVCVLCVPAVVFTNSPQQNLPIGCPGLAKLPNSISFLWESDGLASWYSEETEGGRDKAWDDRKTRWDRWCEEALRRAQWGGGSKNVWLFWVPGLTAVDRLHLPVDGIADHQGADEELGPPVRKMRQIVCSGTKKQPERWVKCETWALM